MNEELTKKLIELIESAQNFTVENAPLYAKELLIYGAFDHTLWMWVSALLGVVILILSVFVFIKESQEGYGIYFGSVLLSIMSLCFFGGVIHNYSKLKMIEKAPRVYILGELK